MNYVDAYNKTSSPCVLDYQKRTKIDGFLYPAKNRELKSPNTLILTVPTVTGLANTSGNFSPFPPHNILTNTTQPYPVQNINEADYIVCSIESHADPYVAHKFPADDTCYNMLMRDILPDSIFA